jgi:hypothetical protein
LPAALAGCATLLIGRYIAHAPRRVLILAVLLVILPVSLWGVGVVNAYRVGMERPGEVWITSVLGKLGLSRSALYRRIQRYGL